MDAEGLVATNTTTLINVMQVLLIRTMPIQRLAVKLHMLVGNPPPKAKPPEIVRIDVEIDGKVI